MRFITDKPKPQLSNHKLKVAETDPPPTPFPDVANPAAEMICGECGREFLQDIPSTRCKSCNMDLCSYDCGMKHQEKTGHYLTHLIS